MRTLFEISKALLGREHQIKLSLCCLFSDGHLLIKDLPGMGKTTLSYALVRALGLKCNRIQFNSDLLPSDILGISIFDQNTAQSEKASFKTMRALLRELRAVLRRNDL